MKPPTEARVPSCDWLHFAARTGEAGRLWAERYASHAAAVRRSQQALEFMRRDELEEGMTALAEYAESVEALPACPRSMRSVFDRWYHGVAGYYFYRIGDFDEAERAMRLARDAVVDAIGEAAFLLLLAVHCKEFCLHEARIARNRRRWTEMNAHVERARAMTMAREPLCMTRGGPITFDTIACFLRSLEPLSPEERGAVQGLVDEGTRVALFERFVRALDRSPDLAIQYQ